MLTFDRTVVKKRIPNGSELQMALSRRFRISEGRSPSPSQGEPCQRRLLGTASAAILQQKVLGQESAARRGQQSNLSTLRQRARAAMSHMEAQIEELRQEHSVEIEELKGRLQEELAMREHMFAELQAFRQSLRLQPPTPLQSPQLSREAEVEAEKKSPSLTAFPEGGLRWAMTDTGATTEELRSAIQANQAVLDEAKRELRARELRERRAALETLYAAIAHEDEAELEDAISEARRVQVDVDDVKKADAALQTLRALTSEERAAKVARVAEAEARKKAFLHVKRDDVSALQAHLVDLDRVGMQWHTWKDHNMRNMLQVASSMRSSKVRVYLDTILKPSASPGSKRLFSECIPGIRPRETSPESSPMCRALAGSPEQLHTAENIQCLTPRGECREVPGKGHEAKLVPQHSAPEATPEAPMPKEAEATPHGDQLQEKCFASATPTKTGSAALQEAADAQFRSSAFRAVVQDDVATLADIIVSKVTMDIWRHWINRGGKDLLTLAEERGSSGAYSMLAKALGILKERRRCSFEEREAVWVMCAGEVQPRRATVLEDTTEDAATVFLEFWDSDEPALRLDRDSVLKSFN